MFVDEAKLAVQLTHPNIAQIFELGKVGDSYFIALEYVAGKDMDKNELVVVQGHDHPLLLRTRLQARDLSWTSGTAPAPDRIYGAKNRYRQADATGHIVALADGELDVVFDEPQWAVTPGQSVVLYQGEVCLGGGVIQ